MYPGYTPCESQKQPTSVNVEVQNCLEFNLASKYLANSCERKSAEEEAANSAYTLGTQEQGWKAALLQNPDSNCFLLFTPVCGSRHFHCPLPSWQSWSRRKRGTRPQDTTVIQNHRFISFIFHIKTLFCSHVTSQ